MAEGRIRGGQSSPTNSRTNHYIWTVTGNFQYRKASDVLPTGYMFPNDTSAQSGWADGLVYVTDVTAGIIRSEECSISASMGRTYNDRAASEGLAKATAEPQVRESGLSSTAISKSTGLSW